jgi:hypothetical protein
VDVSGGAAVQVDYVHPIGHKPPGFHMISQEVYHREPAAHREVRNLFSVRIPNGARYEPERSLTAAWNAVSISLELTMSSC